MIVAVVGASAQQTKVEEAAALVTEARALWEKNQQWPAIDKMKKAVAVDPNNAATHTELADMYLAVKSNDLARNAITEALKVNPNYGPAHHRKAVLLRYAGDFEGSIREARLALSLKPDIDTTAYSHITIGRALMRLKRSAEADDEFRKAVAVYQERVNQNANEASAHAALGNLLFELQWYEDAEKAYRRAFELDSQNFAALRNVASALHNQGKKDEAVKAYQEYLRVTPAPFAKADIEARLQWLNSNTLATLLGHLLINATESGNVSNVKALLAKGADVNFKVDHNTPLNTAAREGHLEIIKMLLAHGAKDDESVALAAAYEQGHADIEALLDQATARPLPPKAATRLMYAAIHRNDAAKFASVVTNASQKDLDEILLYAIAQKNVSIDIVRSLLSKGAQINQPTRYKSALMHAASGGHLAIAELLLAKGADVNFETPQEGTALILAVIEGHEELVKLLLAAGANVKATYRTGQPVLSLAVVGRGDDSKLMQLLLAKGADPNARDRYGNTPLMVANTPAEVELLVTSGANVATTDEQGETALMKAAKGGEAEVVSALLSNGADVNSRDKKGLTALLHSLEYVHPESHDGRKLLPVRTEAARRILLAKRLDVNAQNNDGETALLRAIRLENIELIKALLAKGANPRLGDMFGVIPVVAAYESEKSEIAALLPKASFRRQPPQVLNAFLKAAIEKKDEATVKQLLAAGASANYEYPIGYDHKTIKRTVLIHAAQMGHAGIVQLLLNSGANVNAKGLIRGSEHGLKYGTALEAAEDARQTEIAAILRKAMNAAPSRN